MQRSARWVVGAGGCCTGASRDLRSRGFRFCGFLAGCGGLSLGSYRIDEDSRQ